ncbi:SIR2 family NAD-dependent protein deacylase [Tenacibaculum xiamenense]|uniref:SIR2 family NAD-dependent protein deacylase n=1 Tax=Tenacibaculum xiamenense TaxID=1261553 RepID=UPI0038932827
MNKELKELIFDQINKNNKRRNKVVFLTGAGISAESGIPTYRGTNGIWVKGSTFYKPESFGTFEHFSKNADQVWQYTFFRKKMFHDAKPNKNHRLLVQIENNLQDRFHCITQNIDNLHQRAGTERLYEIHGNLREMRCSEECTKEVYTIPSEISLKRIDEDLTCDEKELLKCTKCGEDTRPNILWFDEFYNERNFKLHSSLKLAKNSSLMIILGTSGATNLPIRLVEQTLKYGGYVIDVNLEDNNFTKSFSTKKRFYSIREDIYSFLADMLQIIN